MRLIHRQSKQPLVEFIGNERIFYNKFLENEMKSLGIVVPPGIRGRFAGKDLIFLHDEEFPQAFREVYFMTTMDPTQFEWIEG